MRINPDKINETIKFIENVTAEFREGNYTFDYYFLEDMSRNQYGSEVNMAKMATLITIISFLITLFGLGGMTYYSLIRKRESISIRKVFGASSYNITFIFLKETGIILLISFVLASTLTQILLENWLSNYSYWISMPYLYFVLIFIFIAMLVGILTIVIVRKESNKNPVNNLRYE